MGHAEPVIGPQACLLFSGLSWPRLEIRYLTPSFSLRVDVRHQFPTIAEGDYIGWSPVSSQNYPTNIRNLFLQQPAWNFMGLIPALSESSCQHADIFLFVCEGSSKDRYRELALWVHARPRGMRESVEIPRRCELDTNHFYPGTKIWALRSLESQCLLPHHRPFWN